MEKVTVLNRMEAIRKVDSKNMLEDLMKTPQYGEDAVQLAKKFEVPNEVSISKNISIKYKKPLRIIITGMG